MSKKTTVTLPEQLDISQAESLKSRLDKALEKKADIIEVKADKVEHADSAGMQMLLSFKLATEVAGCSMSFNSPSEALQTASKLLGTNELLEID